MLVEISHSLERVTGELASQCANLTALRNQAENVEEKTAQNQKTANLLITITIKLSH